MAKPARYSRMSHYGDHPHTDDVSDPMGFTAGPRMASAPARRSGATSLSLIAIALAGIGGGWAMFGDPSTWPDRVAQFMEAAKGAPPAAPPAATASKLAAPEPERTAEPIATSSISKPAEASGTPQVAIAEPPAAKPAEPEAPPAKEEKDAAAAPPEEPQKLPEVVATEPWQKRAVAAGLHPELSRALLDRLSTVDYRNASYAVRTALAETPDSQVFSWPRESKRGLAVFQVKFVEGAPAGCRRYVVTISREGWSTTALPMEKCGIKQRQSAANQGAGNKAVVRPINQ